MSVQVVAVGIVSSHADTNLDGQPSVKFTIEQEDTVANIRDISDIVSTSIAQLKLLLVHVFDLTQMILH